jgi:hypothetical protein
VKILNTSEQLRQHPAWFWLKLTFALFWLQQMVSLATDYQSAPLPIGIYNLFDFSVCFQPPYVWLLYLALLSIVWFYVSEKHMRWVTLAGALLSVVIITHHESNGILKRTTVLSLIWISQTIAYWLYGSDEKRLQIVRLSFSIQMIAALYTLSGIAKLQSVGFQWPTLTVESLPVVALKGALVEYFSRGNILVVEKASVYIQWVLSQQTLFYVLMLMVLLAEVTALTATLSSRLRFLYGIFFTFMHLGIWLFLDIVIAAQACSMILFFLNPAHLLHILVVKLNKN